MWRNVLCPYVNNKTGTSTGSSNNNHINNIGSRRKNGNGNVNGRSRAATRSDFSLFLNAFLVAVRNRIIESRRCFSTPWMRARRKRRVVPNIIL